MKAPEGHLLVDQGQAWSDQTDTSDTTTATVDHYVPLVSKEWSIEKPIAVVIHLQKTGDLPTFEEALGTASPAGLVSKIGLSGVVKEGFAKSHLTISPDVLVVEWQATPETAVLMGKIYFILGLLVIALAGLVTWIRGGFFKRRNVPPVS